MEKGQPLTCFLPQHIIAPTPCGIPPSLHYHLSRNYCGINLFQSLGREKAVIAKGVFSLEKSLESLKSLNFSRVSRKWSDSPLSGGSLESLESLESLNSLESLQKVDFSENTPFPNPKFLRGIKYVTAPELFILPDTQVARICGTEILQIPCKKLQRRKKKVKDNLCDVIFTLRRPKRIFQ